MGDILPKLFSFIVFPVLTTYLLPADYAIINYINTVNTLLTILCFLSLNTYYLVHYYRIEGPLEQSRLIGNLSIFVMSLNVLFTLFMFFIGPSVFRFIGSNIDFYPYLAIGLLTNFFNLFSVLPSALYRVQEKPLPLTLLNVSRGALGMILTLILVARFGFKAEGVLYVNMVVAAIFSILFIRITVKNMVWNVNWRQIKRALAFSLPLLPGSLAYYMITMSDRIFIDKYLSLDDLGIYSTASTLALILNIFSFGAYKAFEPYFFKTYGTIEFKSRFTRVFDVYFTLLLLGALGLGLFAKEFFILFSNEAYHEAYFFVPLILIGVVATSLKLMFGTVITASGRTKISSMITITGGIISVTLNILLLRHWGIIAACISSAVSTCLMLGLSVFFSGIRFNAVRAVILLALCIMATWGAVYVLNITDLPLSIACKALIYLLIFVLAIKIMNINIWNLCLSLFKQN